eukprot:scaffold13393_cov55-Cylindrotheca_fusiformis.AAC.2
MDSFILWQNARGRDILVSDSFDCCFHLIESNRIDSETTRSLFIDIANNLPFYGLLQLQGVVKASVYHTRRALLGYLEPIAPNDTNNRSCEVRCYSKFDITRTCVYHVVAVSSSVSILIKVSQ